MLKLTLLWAKTWCHVNHWWKRHFFLRECLRYSNCWIYVEKWMLFFFFFYLLTSLKYRVLWITWTLRLKGQFFPYKCHFALSRYEEENQARMPFVANLAECKAKEIGISRNKVTAWQHDRSQNQKCLLFLSFMIISSQGKEAVYCHFHRKTFKWLFGEPSVTRVTTRSK